MMYLKFCNTRERQPLQERVISTTEYSVAHDEVGVRVYHRPGHYERVASDAWLNLFVMNEAGKTIDKIEAS